MKWLAFFEDITTSIFHSVYLGAGCLALVGAAVEPPERYMHAQTFCFFAVACFVGAFSDPALVPS